MALEARLLHHQISESESSSQDDEDRPRRRRRRRDLMEHDCPDFEQLPEYVCLMAGASIGAARLLREGQADVAINWTGGRHHAFKDRPSGFCYCNDIALAITELRKAPMSRLRQRISRVLYLDLDVHAGDGVGSEQGAFWTSPNILTLSIHYHAQGFFPTTCPLESHGPEAPSPAAHHSLNLAVPKPGFSDASLQRLWKSCVEPVKQAFRPDAVVLQLGVDGLASDPIRRFNYSLSGLLHCLAQVKLWRLPLLLLGGGGYDNTSCARAWCSAILLVASNRTPKEIVSMQIPESCEDWPEYAPSYTLDVPAGNRRDENTEEDLHRIENAFRGHAIELNRMYKMQNR